MRSFKDKAELDLNLIRALRASDQESFSNIVESLGLDPATEFIGADLSGIDFSGSNLRGYNFKNAYLRDADFSDALLDHNLKGIIKDSVPSDEVVQAHEDAIIDKFFALIAEAANQISTASLATELRTELGTFGDIKEDYVPFRWNDSKAPLIDCVVHMTGATIEWQQIVPHSELHDTLDAIVTYRAEPSPAYRIALLGEQKPDVVNFAIVKSCAYIMISEEILKSNPSLKVNWLSFPEHVIDTFVKLHEMQKEPIELTNINRVIWGLERKAARLALRLLVPSRIYRNIISWAHKPEQTGELTDEFLEAANTRLLQLPKPLFDKLISGEYAFLSDD